MTATLPHIDSGNQESRFGELLNTVEHPIDPCPKCGRSEPMYVHVTVARWECGHTRRLPPITPTGGGPRRYSRAVKR